MPTPSFILHYAPDNASLIVRLALLEMGLPFETRLVDRAANQQNSADYRAIAPTGLIPALETPSGVLFETGAILLHLAEISGRMFPPPADPARSDALKWLFFIATTLHADCRMQFYSARYAGTDPAPMEFRDATRARLSAHLTLLDRSAQDGPTLFWQDGPSVLALYVAVICRWLQLYPRAQTPWFNWKNWPALLSLAQKCEKRPSAIAAARAEGMGAQMFTAAAPPTPPEGSAT